MIEINPQEPPAIIELHNDAQGIAQLRLYGDDCALMGWTGDYKSSAPVAAFLAKAEASNTDAAKAVEILLEQTSEAFYHWRLEFLEQDTMKLAEFLSITCPDLNQRFPDFLVADGDEPKTPQQFQMKLLSFVIRLS
jgi:hypothetical protein